MGDLKVVIRTGAAWSTGCDIGTNDGWYGGAGSSDTASAAYCVNAHDLPKYAVQCPPPPKNVTQGFACEQDTVSPCLFNVTADPCEHYDLSATHADALHTILLRLRQYQVGSVYGPTARHNPDGPECPYVATLNGVKVNVEPIDIARIPHNTFTDVSEGTLRVSAAIVYSGRVYLRRFHKHPINPKETGNVWGHTFTFSYTRSGRLDVSIIPRVVQKCAAGTYKCYFDGAHRFSHVFIVWNHIRYAPLSRLSFNCDDSQQ